MTTDYASWIRNVEERAAAKATPSLVDDPMKWLRQLALQHQTDYFIGTAAAVSPAIYWSSIV